MSIFLQRTKFGVVCGTRNCSTSFRLLTSAHCAHYYLTTHTTSGVRRPARAARAEPLDTGCRPPGPVPGSAGLRGHQVRQQRLLQKVRVKCVVYVCGVCVSFILFIYIYFVHGIRKVYGESYLIAIQVLEPPLLQILNHRNTYLLANPLHFNTSLYFIFDLSHYTYARIHILSLPRRGLAFEGALHRDMGNIEVADQNAAVAFFVGKGLIDKARVGMFGWSYGGGCNVVLFE